MSDQSELSRTIAKMASREWTVTYDENRWLVKTPTGKLVRTYPAHWLEKSIRSQIESLYWNCADNADLALQLTIDGFKLELKQSSNSEGGVWVAQYYNDDFINAFISHSDNPAEAICKAWLKLAEYLESVRIT